MASQAQKNLTTVALVGGGGLLLLFALRKRGEPTMEETAAGGVSPGVLGDFGEHTRPGTDFPFVGPPSDFSGGEGPGGSGFLPTDSAVENITNPLGVSGDDSDNFTNDTARARDNTGAEDSRGDDRAPTFGQGITDPFGAGAAAQFGILTGGGILAVKGIQRFTRPAQKVAPLATVTALAAVPSGKPAVIAAAARETPLLSRGSRVLRVAKPLAKFGGPVLLAVGAGVTAAELRQEQPGITAPQALSQGFVETLGGRREKLEEIKRSEASTPFKIGATSAEIVKGATIQTASLAKDVFVGTGKFTAGVLLGTAKVPIRPKAAVQPARAPTREEQKAGLVGPTVPTQKPTQTFKKGPDVGGAIGGFFNKLFGRR